MLTSTEPCDELRPMVTERFFMRYSNSRPSSRATAAAAAAAILASEGAGRPPLCPAARTGPAAAAAARHRQGRGRRSTEPDAVRRWLMDGGAGPMRGPHAHGAMAARPMASGAEASAAQHVRVSGPENTGKARKTRSRSAGGGAERPSFPRRRQRRREKRCAEPRPRLCGPRERRGGPSPAGRREGGRRGASWLSPRGRPACHLLPGAPSQGRGGGTPGTCGGPSCRRPLLADPGPPSDAAGTCRTCFPGGR